MCVLSCCLFAVVPAKPAQAKPSPAGGGPERLDFDLGRNGEYRFDYATGRDCFRPRIVLNFLLSDLLLLLDAFAKLQNATISFVMSVRPSVRPFVLPR